MRKVKKVLNEKEGWNKIYTVQGVDIYDSCHFLDRTQERFPDLSWITIVKTIEKGMIKIFHYPPGHFVIISKSTGMRIAIDYRKDRFSDEMIVVIPTVLEPNMTFRKFNDTEIIVESINRIIIHVD